MTEPMSTSSQESDPAHLGRRRLFAGAGAIGAGAVLAACGGADAQTTPGTNARPSPSASPTIPARLRASAGGGSAGALTSTSDVPSGGGTVLKDQKVVVTQPKSGEFKAFSAVCTHQGCLVGSVTGGEIVCPCHGSHYSITDGSVLSGPAPSPLPAVEVAVKGGKVVKA